MRNTTVLICDDNISVHESLTAYLSQTGIDVISLYDGRRLMNTLRTHKVDLVILDIMLPGQSGTDLCREIRKSNDIPIIMLSARSEEDDRILGLELGADDYVTKPFSPREVAIRVNTILKRLHPKQANSVLFFSNLILYPSCYKAVISEQLLDLTPKEFSVLQCLIKEPDKVQSRDRILDEVWGSDYFGDTRAVDTIIKRLRAKLAKAGARFAIQSVYGIGYKIEEPEDKKLS